jgi:O-antigen/teichoic acid export membrane protein
MSSENQNIGWSLFLHVMAVALAFVVQIALARWAESSAVFGNYAFHVSLAQSLAILAGLGVPPAALRFISRHLAHRQGDQARRLAGRAYLLIGMSDIVMMGLLCAAAWLIQGEVSRGILWAAIMIPLFGMRFMNETWAQSQHRTFMTLVPGGIVQPVLILFGCLVFFGMKQGVLQPNQLLAVSCSAMVLCAGGQALWLNLSRIRFGSDESPIADNLDVPGRFTIRQLLRVSLPMLIVSGLGIAMSQCDVLMLRWLSGDAATGQYVVAVRISWITVIPLISVNLLAAPAYASLWELKSIAAMRRKARSYAQFIILGTLPIAVCLLLFGKLILGWHGPDYLVGYLPLAILVLGQIVNSAVGSTALLLGMTGYQDVVAKVFAPCAILNIVVNALLIPRWGPTGAAIATAMSLSLWNLALVWVIWKKLKLDTSWLVLLPGRMQHFDGQEPDYGASN